MTTTTTEPGGDAPKRKKKDKPNGKANGAANGVADEKVVPFPEPQAAAADGEEQPDAYQPPEPTPDELDLAGDVFRKLEADAESMGIQAVIDALIGIVDIHPQLRTPEDLFASNDDPDDEDRFIVADNIAEIARFLSRASPKLELNPNLAVFYWKDHEKWTSKGQKVHSKATKTGGLLRHHTGGVRAFLTFNYHLFKFQNPRQKIFDVYRALRGRDAEGKERAPDYVGYFEEPGLFGAGVFEEHAKIARAFVKEAPEHAGDPHQLSLMAGIFD